MRTRSLLTIIPALRVVRSSSYRATPTIIRKLSSKAENMSVANASYNTGTGAVMNFSEAKLSQKFGPEVSNYFSGLRAAVQLPATVKLTENLKARPSTASPSSATNPRSSPLRSRTQSSSS
jgi:hypothetical protein